MRNESGAMEDPALSRLPKGRSASEGEAVERAGRVARKRVRRAWVLALCGLLVAAADTRAADLASFEFSLLGGTGGSLDADPGDGFDSTTMQIGLGLPTEPGTVVTLRVGRIDLENQGQFESLFRARLEYATLAGEYRFFEGYYHSGLYLGLGAYRLDGRGFDGRERGEDSLGVVLGVTADFAVTRRVSFALELAGHYVDFDEAQLFVTGVGGLRLSF